MAINPINLAPYSQSPLLSGIDAAQKVMGLGAEIPLMHAQANYYNARALMPTTTAPAALQLWNAYQKAPKNSEEKAYLAGLLNKQIQAGSGMNVTMGPQGQVASISSGQAVPSSIGSFTASGLLPPPPAGSQPTTVGNTASKWNPRGSQTMLPSNPADPNVTVATSPTTQSTTNAQTRAAGGTEGHYILGKMADWGAPYNSALGWMRQAEDLGKYYLGNPEQQAQAQQNLTNLAAAKSLTNETAAALARQGGVNHVGSTAIHEFSTKYFPHFGYNLIDQFVPANINTAALLQAGNTSKQAADLANEQTINQYATQVPKATYWPAGGTPIPTNQDSAPGSAGFVPTASMSNPGPMGTPLDRLGQYNQILSAISNKMFNQGLPLDTARSQPQGGLL